MLGAPMKTTCGRCSKQFKVGSFGGSTLWRLVCPHCDYTVWVSAPVNEPEVKPEPARDPERKEPEQPEGAGGAPGSRSFLHRAWS